MKIFLTFFITLFFSFFIPQLEARGDICGKIEMAKKTSSQKFVQENHTHPGNVEKNQITFVILAGKFLALDLHRYDHVRFSGFISSGAEINQYLASA